MPFVTWQGKRIFYLTTGNTSGRPALLCIHGAGGNARHWAHQLAMASRWEHDIIAVDLPGHGHSEGEPLETIGAYSRFIEEFIGLMNLQQPVLAGHSMGGAIAMELAGRRPELVSKLILIGTADRFQVAPWLLESLEGGVMPPAFIKLAYGDQADPKLVQQGLQEAGSIPSSLYLTDFLACHSYRLSNEEALRQLPCLLVFGAKDRLTPLKHAGSLREALPSHRLAVIEEAGHMVMIEKADPVNAVIQEFLQT